MFSNRAMQASLAALLVSTLAACSGSGGGDTAVGPGTEVTSSGTITGFGSIFVNGTRFHTNGARIISDDDGTVIAENPSDDELKQILGVGEVVTVRGTRTDDSNGVADTIRIDDELVGDVASVSAEGTFVVNAQTVSVTPDTIIDDSIIEAARSGVEIPNDLRFGDLPETLDQLLTAGMRVEIHGFPSGNGIEATRIEDVTNQTAPGGGALDDEVKGTVSLLGAGQFNINDLVVFYDDNALDAEDFANRSLEDGMFVEVHGNVTSPTTMDATLIEIEDGLIDDDFNEGDVEIEGVVQKIVKDNGGNGGVVTIDGKDLRLDDVSMLSEGLRFEIKGELQGDGSIVVTRLEDESEDSIRVQDIALSADGSSFTTRLGIVVTPSDRSRLEDDTINDDDNAGFLGNVAGNYVESRGFPLNGDTAWTRLEIEDSNDMDCRLRGPATNITGTVADFTFDILTVTVNVSGVSDHNFEGPARMPMGRELFFQNLAEGVIVEAQSDNDGNGCTVNSLVAREVSFEPADDVLFNDDGNGGNNGNGAPDNEIRGSVSNVLGTTFMVANETVTVDGNTVIDSSIIEAARGVEINNDMPRSALPETLQQLLPDELNVVVGVDRSNGVLALIIEDVTP